MRLEYFHQGSAPAETDWEENSCVGPLTRMARLFSLQSVAIGVLASAVQAASASETVARSGPAQVALIELFTSESCSSCPPAEKWLAELRNDAGLWKNFVPVAFHVNYWDHLGWRDALAAKAFTDREYAYADAWRTSSVYTPCFVRNGQEWRPRESTREERGAKDAGVLTLRWQRETNTCRVEFAPGADAGKTSKFEVSITLLGGGIVSAVRKGENAGRELRHEFVVLRRETAALTHDANGGWTANVSVAPRADIAAPRHAIAAWVNARGHLAPLQAAGGWITSDTR
jgi:hypothetical protein